jgi:hypothetical protein
MYKLFLDDLQDFHGASLHADTAGNALGGRTFRRLHHHLHGANFNALAAGGAELLVNQVHTGLGILSDRTGFTDFLTLAALDTGHGLCTGTLGNDLDAGQVFIEFLKESGGAGADALQTGHAFYILFYRKLFHTDRDPLFLLIIYAIIIQKF